MASIIFASAFVWFLLVAPPPENTVQPYVPQPKPSVSVQEPKKMNASIKKIRSSKSNKNKIESFIKQQNPEIAEKDVDEIAFWIDEYSSKEGIDPMLVAALIDRESSFKKKAVSKTGAKGLGQIKDFNFQSLDIDDPYDVKQNVRGTVKYLKHLKDVWKDSKESTRLALASYYQGPNATRKKKNRIPKQVSNYVDDILDRYEMLSKK